MASSKTDIHGLFNVTILRNALSRFAQLDNETSMQYSRVETTIYNKTLDVTNKY